MKINHKTVIIPDLLILLVLNVKCSLFIKVASGLLKGQGRSRCTHWMKLTFINLYYNNNKLTTFIFNVFLILELCRNRFADAV